MSQFTGAMLVCAALLVGWMLGVNWLCSSECAAKAHRMGVAYDYGALQGCMVKTAHGWRPIDSYRTVDE